MEQVAHQWYWGSSFGCVMEEDDRTRGNADDAPGRDAEEVLTLGSDVYDIQEGRVV